MIRRSRQSGGALLAVMWVTAALAAIAFSVANSVRAETERTATISEQSRAHYIATGAVERALLYMFWGPQYRNPDGSPRFYEPGRARLQFRFPSGPALVEIIPESSKISVNQAEPADLIRLLINLGVPPEAATEITAGIVDWRTAAPGGLTPFDQFYLSRTPSFRARHSSLEELEELLLVKGVTPELFYGSYVRDPQGRLMRRTGLKDCVSIYAVPNNVDVNTAEPAVLATIGVNPDVIAAIVERRRAAPFRNMGELQMFAQGAGPGYAKLRVGGGTMFTLRATAQLALPNGGLSDLRRTVSALVKFREPGFNPPYEILRWYDN